jgi:putative nucleotidyltransferase with HDIG domain
MRQKADPLQFAGGRSPELEELIQTAREAEATGALAEARELFERALQLLTSPYQASIAAALFRWIGDTHRHEGAGGAALDAYTVCREVAELNGDLVNLGYALNSLAILESEWGQFEAASELYLEALEVADRIGETRLIAMVAQNTGVLANVRGELDAALRHYRQSLESYRKLDDVPRVAGVLSNLGMLHSDLKQWEEAESVFAESALLSEQVGDFRNRAMVEVNRAEMFVLRREFGRAEATCQEALRLVNRIDHPLGLCEVYKHFGIVFRETGRVEDAESHLGLALDLANRLHNPLLVGEVQRELAQVYRLQQRNRDALQALNAAHRLFGGLQARPDVADIDQRLADLEAIFLDAVRKWGESIKSKDRYTAGHCQRVADLSCRLAELAGMPPADLTWFRMGALLHDVGKTMVPASILNKPGPLSDEEWDVMRKHPVAGVEILAAIEFPWDVRPMIRSHHERWDGTGYPDGLCGFDIPLAARILCVADVFDALTSARSYRAAFTPEEALDIMASQAGQILDPELFRQFEGVIRLSG